MEPEGLKEYAIFGGTKALPFYCASTAGMSSFSNAVPYIAVILRHAEAAVPKAPRR